MKIAAPIAPQALQPPAITPAKTQAPAPLHVNPPNVNGTSPQQVARFASALVQQSRSLSQRELLASGNALQSRAVKLGELYQLLMGSQDKGLDDAARNLRKQLQNQNASSLAQILSYTDGDPAKAHVMLQAARKQAQADGAMGEHVVLSQQLKQLFDKAMARETAAILLRQWCEACDLSAIPEMEDAAATILRHEGRILNFWNNRATNAFAESFNAKIKQFRAILRGIRDLKFFLFRCEGYFC